MTRTTASARLGFREKMISRAIFASKLRSLHPTVNRLIANTSKYRLCRLLEQASKYDIYHHDIQQYLSEEAMSDILAGATHMDNPFEEKSRLGPWLAAWHDPVAGLECNAGCMQVNNPD